MRRFVIFSFTAMLIVCGCDKHATTPAAQNQNSSQSPGSAVSTQPVEPGAAATAKDEKRAATTDHPPLTTATSNPALRRAESLTGAWWKLDEKSHDFGLAWTGQKKSHTFYLTNKGTEILEIHEMKPSCGCVSSERLPTRILPSKAASIVFHADLAGRIGPFLESMTLITNDPERPYVVLEMSGETRTPAVTEVIYDSSLPGGGDAQSLARVRNRVGGFGQIAKDATLKRILRITNTSGQPLSLKLLSVYPNNSQFGASLKETRPNEEHELTIEGRPPFAEGPNKAIISLGTNLADYDQFDISVTAEVVGRIRVVPRMIEVNPDRRVVLDRRITIRHDGTKPFTITGIWSSDASFDLQLLPQDPANPNEWRAQLRLPGPSYVPPPWGDLIRFETTDSDSPTIDVPVVFDRAIKPGPRPTSAPLVLQPGTMPRKH